MNETIREEKLRARVQAANRAGEVAAELHKDLAAVFTPLVGQRVMKIGGLLAKYEKLLPPLPRHIDLHVYRQTSDYQLAWVVKTCEPILGHGCMYHEVTVYVGELQDGVLTKIQQEFVGRTDYTVEEVLRKREEYVTARKALENARSALHPFGERDD